VLGNAIAFGIHACQLPARADLPVVSSIAVGFDRLLLLPALVSGKAETKGRPRVALLFVGITNDRLVERVSALRCNSERPYGDGADQTSSKKLRDTHDPALLSP